MGIDLATASILVTGASTGIGRAIALHFVAAGSTVFAGVRKKKDADALTEAASGPGRLVPVFVDVTKSDQVAALATTLDETLAGQPLHALINNAGITVGGPLEYLALDDMRWQFEVNVFGQLAVTQAVLPLLRRGLSEQPGGTSGWPRRILNIGSIGGQVTTPMMAPYNMSKFALSSMSEGMRQELRGWGIWVGHIEPGTIKSAIWEKGKEQAATIEQRFDEEARRRYGHPIAKITERIGKQANAGVGADWVARSCARQLTTGWPRCATRVGPDAHLLDFLHWLLPDSWMEFILRKATVG